jgi:putative ABC transport system ATP-binding protein
MMHLLGCLDTPTSGRYLLEDRDVSTLSHNERARLRNARIGFVFQTFNLLPRLSALDNVALPLLYRIAPTPGPSSVAGVTGEGNRSAWGTKQRATQALDRVGLANRANHRPVEMSGGERQRVAIARALVADPALVLADEPTGNLDSQTGASIMRLLADLSAEGRTILMVTHDASVAAYTQRIVRMQDGQIIE